MKLPPLPEAASVLVRSDWDTVPYFTSAQIRQLQHDTAEAVLEVVYKQANAYGKTGECMWIGVKAAVRHALKELK